MGSPTSGKGRMVSSMTWLRGLVVLGGQVWWEGGGGATRIIMDIYRKY